ncbi:MAG: T9SS type A sorting domain-containing protein [Bacteroidetes bacterium]|nr:T9SS type A sorting domain-containing protein [Bacteroidota bacterium]
MKKIYLFLTLFLVLFLSLSKLSSIQAQCLTGAQIGTLNPITPIYQTQVITAGVPAYYNFVATAGGVYVFTYCSNGGSYTGDTYLTITNGVPAAQASNDDFCGLGSQITWTCPTTGTYRLYVSGCCPCANAPSAVLAYGCSSCAPPAPPTVASFSPVAGCANTASVVITGTNFSGASAVTFGGTNALSFVVNSPTQITATPAGGATGPIAVTTVGGTGASVASFTVNQNPTVTASTLTPVICVGGSANLTAVGTGFAYVWNPGNLLGANQTVTPAASTIYTVTALAAGGCSATSIVSIAVSPMGAPPSLVTATPSTVCGNVPSQLNGIGVPGGVINWFTVPSGGVMLGSSPTGVNFPVNPAVTTTYYAEAYANIAGSQTFNYTGAVQTFTVPAGVSEIFVDVRGAKGGNGANLSIAGNGGRVQGSIPVTAGAVLNINVGGMGVNCGICATGGFNGGGGTVAGIGQEAGTGGGASDIRVAPYALGNRLMVAGGGGGGGYTGAAADGGAGGGLVGANGQTWNGYAGGTGGTQVAGGIGGPGQGGQPNAISGSLGLGGAGQGWSGGGGGGGGGYYGGGGGFIGGGGGGSNYASPTANGVVHTQGFQASDGQIIISWNSTTCPSAPRVPVTVTVMPPPPVVTAVPASITVCQGTPVTLAGFSAPLVPYTWSGGISDNTPFTPMATTTYTVTGTDGNGCTGTATAVVTVNPVNNGTGSASPTPICLGNTTTITGIATPSCSGNVSDFAGYYAPANWSAVNVNSNGTVNAGGAPANIIINSGTNNSGIQGTTGYSITVGCAGTVSFNWAYTHADAFGSIFDYPRYTINGGAPIAFSAFVIGGAQVQNGVQSIVVNNGDVLQLQMYTLDNDAITGVTTISNFSAPALGYTGTASIWDAAVGGNNLGASPQVVTPAVAGVVNYYVEITSNGPGNCSNPIRVAVPVTVNTATVTASASPSTICEGSSSMLMGSGALTYSWNPGALVGMPTVTPLATTTYTVTGLDAGGCTGTATVEVTVNPAPVITATATPATTCTQTVVTPSASGAPTIAWTGGVNNNVPFIANATTTYTVTGTDGIGCTGSTTVLVTVNPMSGILAPATTNQTQDHGDDFNVNYYDASCDLIATVDDGAGGNILGLTTSTVTVDPGFGIHNGQPFVRRWYQITPTNNGSADVVLYINQSDFDNYNLGVALPYLQLPTTGNNADPNISNIRITKNTDAGLGNSPVVITPSVNWNGTYWELSFNTPSFSQFRVHSVNPGNVPLPATVTNFSGLKLESADQLSWTTSSEQNNAFFNLQHSTDGSHFTTLAKVNSKAPNGTSATTLNYSSINNKPSLGHNYYRLQQVDMDGKVSVHAQIVDLIWGATGSTVSIYPNPTTDILNIDLYAVKDQNTTVKLLDMSGRVIKQIQAKSAVGMNNIKLSMGEIASGVYTIQVYENNTLSHTSKVKKKD